MFLSLIIPRLAYAAAKVPFPVLSSSSRFSSKKFIIVLIGTDKMNIKESYIGYPNGDHYIVYRPTDYAIINI